MSPSPQHPAVTSSVSDAFRICLPIVYFRVQRQFFAKKKQRNNFKSGLYILDQICSAVIACNSVTLAILFVSWNHSHASVRCCDVSVFPLDPSFWVTCWSAAKKPSRGRDFWKQCRATELGKGWIIRGGTPSWWFQRFLWFYYYHGSPYLEKMLWKMTDIFQVETTN